MSRTPEFLRRQRDRLQYALFTSSIDPRVPVRRLVRDIFDPTKSESDIYRTLVHLATKPWGKAGERLGRRLHERYYDVSNTPLRGIAENPPKLIGYGGENFVFLHTPQDTAPFVLKIDKRSLRLVPEEINERARAIKSRHQQIREWYQDIPNFVVPTHFFVARLPFRNAVAVGSIQEYFPEARDLFTEFTESELVEIFIQDRKLQTNFSTFVDRFFTILANSGQSIDLVGHQNVCLIKGEEGRYELRLLDTADIKERDEEQEKFRFTIREARRNKLKRLIEKIAIIPDSFEELPRGQ